jgi:hypothetical protein
MVSWFGSESTHKHSCTEVLRFVDENILLIKERKAKTGVIDM